MESPGEESVPAFMFSFRPLTVEPKHQGLPRCPSPSVPGADQAGTASSVAQKALGKELDAWCPLPAISFLFKLLSGPS